MIQKEKLPKLISVKDGGEVVETYSPAPAYSVQWKPRIKDAGNKYFFVRVWNAAGNNTQRAETASNSENAEGSEPAEEAKNTQPSKAYTGQLL